jgi:hypothetical protein
LVYLLQQILMSQNGRVVPESHRLEGPPEEAFRGMMRFMNVQYHYQLLLRREMGQLVNVA